MNAVCVSSLSVSHFQTHSLHHRKQGVQEGREKGIKKKNLLCLGGCGGECQGDRKWMFLVREGNPLRSSRERCCLAGCIRALPLTDGMGFKYQGTSEGMFSGFDATATRSP